MKDQYIYEISLNFDEKKLGYEEILKGVLVNQGVALKDIIEMQSNGKSVMSFYYHDDQKARAIKRDLMRYQIKDVEVLRQRLKKRDWQTVWKKDFKPLWLTKKLRVVPAWLKSKPRYKKPNSVFIDTSIAFGTGMHATTRFTAQLIENCRGKFGSFLDIGTGTGILSIVAMKCGADSVSAIDISADAIKIAKSNLVLNDCSPDYLKAIDFSKLKQKKKYDFVAANLITDDLIKFSKKIVSLVSPGGYLAISGVSLKNYELIRECFKGYPLRCMRFLKGEGWTAVLFKKARKDR